MPTGDDYRRISVFFETKADEVLEHLGPLDQDWSDAAEYGKMAGIIDLAVDATKVNVATISDEYAGLKDICIDRANACDAFDEDVRQFNRDVAEYYAAKDEYLEGRRPNPPEWPGKPAPPEPWITSSVRMSG